MFAAHDYIDNEKKASENGYVFVITKFLITDLAWKVFPVKWPEFSAIVELLSIQVLMGLY